MKVITRRELASAGWGWRRIRGAVEAGDLRRARNGRYLLPTVSAPAARAVQLGGVLGCVSALRELGVWVAHAEGIHVHVPPRATRLPRAEGVRRHSEELHRPPADASHCVDTLDALLEASRCLSKYDWMACVDSALHSGLLDPDDLRELRDTLPASRQSWTDHASTLPESGLETIVGAIARDLGFQVRFQVPVAGIGRLDVLLDDAVPVETDGAEFHISPAATTKDRRRDAALARVGRPPLRFTYAQVMFDRVAVAEAMIGAVRANRAVRNSGVKAERARKRLGRLIRSGVLHRGD